MLKSLSNLPVAILAGGFATRLHPLTQSTPKALIPVAGFAFIDWQLAYLKKQGIQRVVICVGHFGEAIQNHLANTQHNLDLIFSCDGKSPLGTGGALKNALPWLGDAFFVLYGDSYLPISFQKLAHAFTLQNHPALMTLLKNENRDDVSNVMFKNGILIEYNKQKPTANMAYIDYGLSIISTQMLTDYPKKAPFDLADFYHDSSLEGSLGGYEVTVPFYEIGTPQGLKRTESFLSNRSADLIHP